MALLPCPYLQGEVELTNEREEHIAEQHPDILPAYRDSLPKLWLIPTRYVVALALTMLDFSPSGSIMSETESISS